MFSPENFFNLTSIQISSSIIVFNILFAFILEAFIAFVYKKTHSGISYSSSFVSTIVLMGVISSVVMMVVQHNLAGAVGLIGAFSLIRFRTIIKETRDIAFVFFSLAVGVAIGTNNYSIAVIATLLVSAVAFVLAKFRFGSIIKSDFILTFILPFENTDESYKGIFSKFLSYSELLHIKTIDNISQEYAFEIRVKNNFSVDQFISNLKSISKINNIDVISSSSDVEY